MMIKNERRECIKEFLLFAFTLMIVIMVTVIVSLFFTAKKYYKMGYEEATKDFYYGELKTDMIDQKVVWKNE